jgi:hypothetical protein
MGKHWRKVAVLPIACSLVVVACGTDDDGASDTAATQEPTDTGETAATDATCDTTTPGGSTTAPKAGPSAGGEGEVATDCAVLKDSRAQPQSP